MNPDLKTNTQLNLDDLVERRAKEKLLHERGHPLNATDFSEADQRRFWEKVDKRGPDECWEWNSALTKSGYGNFGFRGKTVRASRVSYALHYGKTDQLTLHSCDNPKCVNPNHLFQGTHKDNSDDKIKKGRYGSPRKLLGEEHQNSKLLATQVMEMRSLWSAGKSTYALAKYFGISRWTVRGIVRHQRWTHLH